MLKNFRTPRGLKIESLENRSLMAADIDLMNGVLNVVGTSGNDRIQVAEVVPAGNGWDSPAPATTLRVTITNRDNGQVLKTQDFSKDSVQNLIIHGDSGNDQLINQTSKPSVIFGGDGNDTVEGGSNVDVVADGSSFSNQQLGYDLVRGGDSEPFVRNGILFVQGMSDNNKIEVAEVPAAGNGWGGTSTTMLRVTITNSNSGFTYWSKYFDKAQVRHIAIDGNAGYDDIFNRTSVPATIFASSGGGSIQGGAAADLIFGGSGDDYLNGQGGNDVLKGGDGIDRIWGGAGNDRLEGGNDRDFLYGEAGSDWLYGEGGNDVLHGGGSGSSSWDDKAVDYLIGGQGSDEFHAYRNSWGNSSDELLDYVPASGDILSWDDGYWF